MGRLFARQGEVADDDTDPVTIELLGPAIEESAVTGMEQQLKEWVEACQSLQWEGDAGKFGQGGELGDEAAASGIDPISCPCLRVIDRISRKEPATGGDIAGSAAALPDILPESLQVRGIGEDATYADDCYGVRMLNVQAAPNWTRPGWGS